MASLGLPLVAYVVANVTEAGDIALLAMVLALTLFVGLALFGLDTLMGRLRSGHHGARARARPGGGKSGASVSRPGDGGEP